MEKKKLILFDFDSTLVNNETIDEIAKEAGVEEEVKKITKEAMEGKLNFEQSLKKRVNLLKDLPVEKVENAMKRITLTEGAEETIKELKNRGYIVAVVSGGFDIAVNRIKEKLGLDYAFANRLIVKDGKLTGEVEGEVLKEDAKGEILQKIAEIEGIKLEDTVVVGDGANDISMFKKAGFKIAFCAKPVLKEKADVCVEKRDLREILKYLKREEG
ncbi:phosphoserine phosphatase SerB [Methanocaldococcus vulcanius M7]|uniref:phosphoserine phosphatase n=1 Tax=Methanocaldococcus vulcanius (strain ATCC 700851 / DSM 12094 / M7) TaxID=579137 RepID=C9RE02_METVM|nr:phosphoserine phosphatase SerB [Methanocaldococcus vulcanius]ACX73531.1 phosphoserine phosphatase SerB [Methanocaldococcus vulcanius M7]